MSEQRLIRAAHSPAFLPDASPLRRQPRAPHRDRPPAFHARYEDRALAYDCFWHKDGARILVVGPPPMNLRPLYRAARYEARPSGAQLRPRYHASLSTMISALDGAPADTSAVIMRLGDEAFELPVQPGMTDAFAGRRVLFTMSKDNDLVWIADWARWHVRQHGTDAIVFIDNGSSRYPVEQIEETLLGVPGIDRLVVQNWPYRYGMTDPAMRIDPFYVLFLQVSAMSVVLRRYAARAAGLLNADVDELVATPAGTTIHDLARRARHGLVVMRGRYMAPVVDEPAAGKATSQHRHRDFLDTFCDARRALSRPRKWALDPTRDWVSRLDVHPYMHWIAGRPPFGKSSPRGVFYRHFQGINTGWKDRRAAADLNPADLARDDDFARLVASDAF